MSACFRVPGAMEALDIRGAPAERQEMAGSASERPVWGDVSRRWRRIDAGVFDMAPVIRNALCGSRNASYRFEFSMFTTLCSIGYPDTYPPEPLAWTWSPFRRDVTL
jgi:hypothetical protein